EKLASHGISANVIAAYYHDHIFVQAEKADQALLALKELS
ncbi:MAG: ACT domain-containing protein, partial [Psychromonas sp.]